jgi:tryptophan synthase beta chain
MESHSVSAGLDYAGVGPELADLVDRDRVTAVNVDDDGALEGFHRLSQLEGVIPALESAHAVAYVEEHHGELGDVILLNISGRGDKDLETVLEETHDRDVENAPDIDTFGATGGFQ